MNCQKFESIVGELARGRMMEVDIRRDALAHSDECSRCTLRLRDEDMLTRIAVCLSVCRTPALLDQCGSRSLVDCGQCDSNSLANREVYGSDTTGRGRAWYADRLRKRGKRPFAGAGEKCEASG